MSRSICHIATEEDVDARLDVLLALYGFYPSRSSAARAIEQGRVLVNASAPRKKYRVSAGDSIVCELDDDDAGVLRPEDIPLDIRYEDDDLIVLSKQAGLVCHPSVDYPDHTLVNALLYHCGREHLCNVQGDQDRLGIVHRLDRDTSGLMLAAKNDACGAALMDAIRIRAVDRRYITLVFGMIMNETGLIDAPIARSASTPGRMAVRDADTAREALTSFRVLERFEATSRDDGYSLLECKLFTGRTHQVRVHMQYIGHPVVGDAVYCAGAPRARAAQLDLSRQFLHSYALSFTHPVTEDELSFFDDLPKDLANTLETLSCRSCGKTEAGQEVSAILASAPKPTLPPFAETTLKEHRL